ncbi:hypothetical protein HK102_011377 [Quaeritorhiza haematococci]|nr:hypothetical protein HK102_011377 [Quaeritorhiza haematococci]
MTNTTATATGKVAGVVAVAASIDKKTIEKEKQVLEKHLLQPHRHLSTLERYRNNFCAGGIALSTAFAVMHPLDTLKTRMQAAAGSTSSTVGAQSNALRSILSWQALRSLSTGFFTSVLGAGPQGGLRLATYEFTKSHLLHTPSASKSHVSTYIPTFGPIAASTISAICGDVASSIVKVPLL